MKQILVIEDNGEVRENLCEILELSGYQTVQAENGKIGVEAAKSEMPDMIICDVMMPVLDGFGVLRILNRDPMLMHVPFMFLTAKAEKTDFRKGMGLGADDYITKPFDEVELLDAIEMRLRKRDHFSVMNNTEQGVRSFFSEAKADDALRDLSENREHRKYRKKSTIYEVDKHPVYLYFIISGGIKTIQYTDHGKELITSVYGPGDFLGMIPILQDVPYQNSAISTEDTEVILIPKEDFKLVIFNDRDFSAKFIQMLAHHASYSESQLIDLAFSSVRKKVANALITLADKKQSDIIDITRDDLAAMAGTARESVIRTLSDFKNEQLIAIEDGHILIKDKSGLADLPQ